MRTQTVHERGDAGFAVRPWCGCSLACRRLNRRLRKRPVECASSPPGVGRTRYARQIRLQRTMVTALAPVEGSNATFPWV